MLTRPTCPQLIEAVRAALREQIGPMLQEKTAHSALGMIDSILENAARRCEHEIAWMREEIGAIETVAERVLAAGADGDARVANALADLRRLRKPSDHTPDVMEDYDRAGELLSVCLEAPLDGDAELRQTVEDTLFARIEKEAEIRGAFTLVGRT